MSWIPLHVHSQFSILDSTISVKHLTTRGQEYGMAALALTDQGNLHGAVDFYQACVKVGIKPIIGCELYMAPLGRKEKRRVSGQKPGYPIVLLAKDATGYTNLCQLSSIAYLEGFYYTPRIDQELLSAHAQGLICLSGPMGGKIAQLIVDEKDGELERELDFYQKVFGDDFYFELTLHTMAQDAMQADGMDKESWLWQASLDMQKSQQRVFKRLIELGKKRGIATVATNDSRYLDRKDWQAHEILINIASGEPREIWERDALGNPKARILNPKRKVRLSHELYFKSPEEMASLFHACPEALAQTLEVADKCSFELDFSSKFYPVFVPPHLEGKSFSNQEREKEAAAFLRTLCNEGVERRYDAEAFAKVAEKYPERQPQEVVRERLAYELELITSKGLCDYLLIVYDFIAWAKRQKIPVGPGRGSGAGSIVCYLTGITDIEPLRFNLFFERFINPERISYPDIDVDICMDRRAEVIDYTIRKYGKANVAQIITFGKMKARMSVKDGGRVSSVPLAKVNKIASLIPEEPNMTLDRALALNTELRSLYETEEETRQLIDVARTLEGSVRNTGIHAAGLIICADPLPLRIPVCNAKDSDALVTQYAMKQVEAVGMLKIDFLGLKTLTAIQLAVTSIAEREGVQIPWVHLPLDDQPTFALLNHRKTLGIFQMESGGMQELAKQVHIDKFEEVIAVGALYRPGPMEMIPSFIARKHGKEKIEFDHPKMRDILEETYGIMVYQEQVMMIAERLAGYSLGQGDVLRKAMGKKDREEMERQREKFRLGCIDNGISEQAAIAIFDKIQKFASYGFNKSHAAAYGYLSYVTAYLKANYPLHWMAALLTTDREDLSKVTKIIQECQAMGIAILPPDVNESGDAFTPAASGIRFAISAVKGVGTGVVEVIVAERKEKGPYQSLYDLIKRIDTHKVGKKTIENLIAAGAFDFTGWQRSELLASVESMFLVTQKDQRDRQRGEMTFFPLIENSDAEFERPPAVDPLEKMDVLRREKELLGFYLTGHPLDELSDRIARLSCINLSQLKHVEKGSVCRIACVIETLSKRIATQSGKKFAILTIGQGDVRFELPIWPDLYQQKGALLVENQLIYAVVVVDRESGGNCKLKCCWLDDLTRVDEEMIRECDLAYDRARMQAKMAAKRPGGAGKGARRAPKKGLERKLFLTLDVSTMRLSHVLKLKAIFRSRSGQSPLVIRFVAGQKPLSTLEIDGTYGVELSADLQADLEKIPALVDISATEG